MGLFGFFWNQQGGAKYKDAASTYTHAHTYAHAHTLFSLFIYIDVCITVYPFLNLCVVAENTDG